MYEKWAQARIQGGGIWGMCPPLEPNAQRKNLRRLKDLRGPIQRNRNFENEFFFAKDILLSPLFNSTSLLNFVYSTIWYKEKSYMPT